MDEATYQRWWPLHMKNAKGESLTPEEQSVYEAGRDQLYAEENLNGSVEDLKQRRARVLQMEEQLVRMMEEYRALKARSESLENQLDEPHKQQIGVGR